MIMNTRNDRSSILMIYTGGTIGMKEDPKAQALKPFDFSQILAEVPELGKYAHKIDSYTFSPLIDSSDVEPGLCATIYLPGLRRPLEKVSKVGHFSLFEREPAASVVRANLVSRVILIFRINQATQLLFSTKFSY